MKDLFDIQGKCVVITGGGGVLCGCIAEFLARRGAKVALWDIAEEFASQRVNEITQNNGVAIAVKCNVLDKQSIIQAKQETEKQLGAVDILINGAGGNKKEATATNELPFSQLPIEAVRFVFDLNFVGTFVPCQVFADDFAKRGEGVILNISSMNALRPLTRIAAYSAAKAAVSNFTQWLAVHMCKNYSANIRVNAIAPGFFLTEQNRFLLTEQKTGDLTSRGKTIIEHTPMNRFGEAEDLNCAVLWLVSDASKFVTGTIVPIDGGFSAFSGV